MFVDASALTAILLLEPEARNLLQRLEAAHSRLTSPLAVWETAVAIARALHLDVGTAAKQVDAFLKQSKIESVPIAPEMATLAILAFDRYGKGRHPAKLNFGDCFAYACARYLSQPLLYKGDDFPLTDIETA